MPDWRALPQRIFRSPPVVPVVRIAGAIGTGMRLRQGVSLESLAGPLERAFAVKSAPAVALVINSPGGMPAQSHLIFRRIRALAEEKKRTVLVFVEDVAASGGYMIALAGDEIIVDPSSIVGSIGVISAGFGFQGLIEKLGIERRIHTAGENKAILDPFAPERPADVARLAGLQRDIHGGFIEMVKARRGARLKDDPDLFTGAFWTGSGAIALGLADRIGDIRTVVRERFGAKTELKLMAARRSWWRRGIGLARADGAAAGLAGGLAAASIDAIIGAVDESALWRRYGL